MHKLDKQLALLAAYEPYGWEKWKSEFINLFRDPDENFQTVAATERSNQHQGETWPNNHGF
jgi:hypothetical protein